MQSYGTTKIASSDIRMRLRVRSKLFELTSEQLAHLDKAPVGAVFSPTFLAVALHNTRRSIRQLELSGERAILALRTIGVQTFAELRASSYEKLAGARGMGAGSLSLVLDLLQAFGFEAFHDKTPIEPFPHMNEEGRALLLDIGVLS